MIYGSKVKRSTEVKVKNVAGAEVWDPSKQQANGAAQRAIAKDLRLGATESAQPQASADARHPFAFRSEPKWLRPVVTHAMCPCTQQAGNGMPRVLMQCSDFFNVSIQMEKGSQQSLDTIFCHIQTNEAGIINFLKETKHREENLEKEPHSAYVLKVILAFIVFHYCSHQ